MTNVMDEAADKLREQIDNFQMPKPVRGQSILWYPHGIKTERAEIGFVLKANRRNIEIRLAAGLPREAVSYIDDPRLANSEVHRENGAWDFTDEYKEIRELKTDVATLKSSLKELEELVKT